MHQNTFAAVALFRTPLWELTALPRPLAGFKGGERGERKRGMEMEEKRRNRRKCEGMRKVGSPSQTKILATGYVPDLYCAKIKKKSRSP